MSEIPKKIAYIATVFSHILAFHIPYIKLLKEQGYEVHVYAKLDTEQIRIPHELVIFHETPFSRMPLQFINIKAFFHLLKGFREEKYDLIHVHTPVGSVLGRIAARVNHGPKVIYTAHGFHFYRGGPYLNWILFYPLERALARWTDGIITINDEDYKRASSFPIRGGQLFKLNGMGIQINKFNMKDSSDLVGYRDIRKNLRKELDIEEDAIVLITVAELNSNKNQQQVLKSMALLHREHSTLHYVVVGKGPAERKLRKVCQQYNLQNRVHFLGYREDVYSWLTVADIFLLTSLREGLGLTVIEAMAAGLPIIMTDTVGGRTLIENGMNGFLVPFHDAKATAKSLKRLIMEPELVKTISANNIKKSQDYSLDKIKQDMINIYKTVL